MRTWLQLALVTALLAPSLTAQAHFPNLSEGRYGSAEDAFVVEDPAVSMVVYHEVTCDALQLWFTFEAEEGFPLVAQLAVPELERLADYRPNLALVGPGLPALAESEVELPFALPDGAGVQVWDTSEVEPEAFYEPFTGTNSWILATLTDWPLPATGRYYLVAWSPTRETGKLWLVVGIEEDFSGIESAQEFTALLNGVKAFHEKDGELDVTEEVCPEDTEPGPDPHDGDGHDHGDDHDHADVDDHGAADVATASPDALAGNGDAGGDPAAGAATDGGTDGGAGCAASTAARPAGAWLVLAALLALLGVRRRTACRLARAAE